MSKNVGISALSIIAVAGTASAAPLTQGPHTNLLSADQYTLTKSSLSAGGTTTKAPPSVIYSEDWELNGNLYAVSAGSGQVSFDDYTTTGAGPTDVMTKHRFAGGVAAAGQVIFFTFFTATSFAFATSYGVQLPAGGAYLWTITMGTPRIIPSNGIVAMWADDGSVVTPSVGTWYLSDLAPTIGSTGASFPGFTASGAPLNHIQQIETPAPAGLALLGLGGALAARRRR